MESIGGTVKRLLFLLVLYICTNEGSPSPSSSRRAHCPSAIGSPRKEVVCYFQGKRAASTVDACLCTHIVYTDVGLDHESRLSIADGALSDLAYFRKQNPSARLVASLGGKDVVFGGLLVGSSARLSNLTSSVNDLYREGVIDGVEIDWEWPAGSGDKDDREKLVKYARQIKIAVGAEVVTAEQQKRLPRLSSRGRVLRRLRREESGDFDDYGYENDDGPRPSSLTTASSVEDGDLTTPFTTSKTPKLGGEDEEEEEEDDSVKRSGENWRARGFSRHTPTTSTRAHTPTSFHTSKTTSVARQRQGKRQRQRVAVVKRARKGKAGGERGEAVGRHQRGPQWRGEEGGDDEESDVDESALDDLRTLVDLFLDEEEKNDDDFLIFLRLSPVPEYLVKGYDFKMLNKFVDFYTLPSHNMTAQSSNATYHHSRLMGVSDIGNADSLLDVVIGLGATDNKIILTGTAFGNVFTLIDAEQNMPGASVSDVVPLPVTYQQVCKAIKNGNWTLEREEDMTGPYTYNGRVWIAFDDDISLKIKAKYALLRNLGGVGLFSIDADDADGVCGKGHHSLLHSLYNTMATLDRKPRQLIVHSLEEDLYAEESNLSPVGIDAGHLNLSPFRIVRIVDQEGIVKSVRENSETVLECTRQGYYRHPQDCSRFYRCVKFNQYENDYTIFEYGCPEGLVFDDRWEVCVWPSQAPPCDGSSEIAPVPRQDYSCPAEGYFVDPENCRWFFACLDHKGDGYFTHYEFRCPFGLAFDEEQLLCNWPWLVPACGGTRQGRVRTVPKGVRGGKSFGGGGRRPAHNRGKAPGGGGLANSRFPHGGGAFQSSAPARLPSPNPVNRQRQRVPRPHVVTTPRPTPAPTTPHHTTTRRPFRLRPRPTPGPFHSEIVSDSCEGCESPTITIGGHGQTIGTGIEIAGGFGRPQKPRRGKQNNGGANGGYKYTGYTPPPSYSGTTTAAPDYASPSTPSPSSGYQYPVPDNPLFLPGHENDGIGISHVGEIGLIPGGYDAPSSPAYRPATTPNTTPYAPPPRPLPTTPAPAYSPSPAYAPSTTRRPPAYRPTTPAYAPPPPAYSPSTTRKPAYQQPAYNPTTTPRPTYRPTTKAPVYGASAGPTGYDSPPAYERPRPDYEQDYNRKPAYASPTTPRPYPSTTKAPVYQPSYRPSPAPAYKPKPSPTYRPSPAPAYKPKPSPTYRPSPSPTYRPSPSYPSTTSRPVTFPSPSYREPTYAQASDDNGYTYPVPKNPLVLPERRPAQPSYRPSPAPAYKPKPTPPPYKDDFNAPEVEYGGFQGVPPIPDHPTPRPNYQQPKYKNPRPAEIEYGFKPSYNQDIPKVRPPPPAYKAAPPPAYKPAPPPAYKPAPPPAYKPAPPPAYKPDYTDQQPSYVSNLASAAYDYVATTIAPYVPTFTTPRPTPPKPAPTSSGYRYPVPANPLKFPTRKGKQFGGGASHLPHPAHEVASVSTSGFTSATLSNGPHSLPDDDFIDDDRPLHPFRGHNGRPGPAGFNAFNTVPASHGGSGRPHGGLVGSPRPSGSRLPLGGSGARPPTSSSFGRPSSGFGVGRPTSAGSHSNGNPKGNPGLHGSRPASGTFIGSGGVGPRPAGSSSAFKNVPHSHHGGSRPHGGIVGPSGSKRPFGGSASRPSIPSSFGSGSGRPNSGRPSSGRPVSSPNSGIGRPTSGGRPGGAASSEFRGNRPVSPASGPKGSPFSRPAGGSGGGRPGFGPPAGRPGLGGRPGGGSGGGRPGFGAPAGRPGLPPIPTKRPELPRGGRQQGGLGSGAGGAPKGIPASGIAAFTRPNHKQPAILGKLNAGSGTNFIGNDWNKFGPGGFRTFNDTIGPEVCDRPGLFRHPTECDKFYECYYDKWINRYTLHVFPCPVVLGFDTDLTACNYPFAGPSTQCSSGAGHQGRRKRLKK